ncbi:putative GPR1/FUN34/yaaH family protein [Lyophyllum shimeji]|uniref:GPR1/FUN34/yaaH family protein n=1 Tax=Lyophyllum shimeji TaxID=47721 RepID=A0A9P3PEB7_LYOSH|nr:putative GPR1/FUN34/yaaH family protein [Lyophyllum shimeji]
MDRASVQRLASSFWNPILQGVLHPLLSPNLDNIASSILKIRGECGVFGAGPWALEPHFRYRPSAITSGLPCSTGSLPYPCKLSYSPRRCNRDGIPRRENKYLLSLRIPFPLLLCVFRDKKHPTHADMNNGHDNDMEKGASRETAEYAPRNADPIAYTRKPTRMANPGPAGLFAFASTTFLLSMYNVNTRGIHTPNVIVGMAIFAGGLVQLLAGMWMFPYGNVFGATAFSMYGAFWLSYATIFIPGSGVLSAYADERELANALGMYLMVWFMVTVMFILPVMRRSVAYTVLLSALATALLLLAIAEFNGMPKVMKAGGVFGIITGLVAYYIGISEILAAEETAIMRVPLGSLHTST